jgi:hypothetical protein
LYYILIEHGGSAVEFQASFASDQLREESWFEFYPPHRINENPANSE